MEKLKIALCQMEISLSLEKNLNKILDFLNQDWANLFIFPELALTGYREDLSELVSSQDFKEALKVLEKASQKWTFLLGAPFLKEGKLYNALYYFTEGKGRVITEKGTLFTGLDDRACFAPGSWRKKASIQGIPFYGFICFELRWPNLWQAYALDGAFFLVVCAQWPKIRLSHWETLLKARSIETQLPVLGVNALGQAFGSELGGNSLAVLPNGTFFPLGSEERVEIFELDFMSPSLPYPRRNPFPQRKKILSLSELLPILEKRRSHGERIVFTNGCFDLLHAGHVDYLEKARSLGDLLVVGLNSDSSIKRIKGKGRPINPQELRAKILASLSCVDYVVIFEEDTPKKLIEAIRPQVLVKGEDWPEEKIVGSDFVKSYGGEIVRIPFVYKISTSKLINKIKEENT